MKLLKPLIASVMASGSLVGLAQSDFSQVGLSQPGYKYEKPAGADNFYHTYNASEQQVSFLELDTSISTTEPTSYPSTHW